METFLAGARVVVSLAVVLGLLWMLQRRLTRGSRKSAAGHPVTIVTKQAISPKASVVIIDVDGTRLLLGVTEHAVSVLQSGDAPAPAIEAAPAPSGAKAFAESLSKVAAAAKPATATLAKPATKVTTKAATTAATNPTTRVAPAAAAAKKAAAKSPEFTPVAAFTGRATPAGGMLAGSILSPTTWKQLGATIRRGR